MCRGTSCDVGIGETGVQVRFMKQVEDNVFMWPENDDLSMVEDWEVLKALDTPDMIARGRYAFTMIWNFD